MLKILKFLLLLISVNFCDAQTLKGIVKDSLTGKEVSYANIVLKNGKGTYSDEYGKFELKKKKSTSDTLKVSILGYKTKLLLASYFEEGSEFEVLLSPKSEDLDEVVISSRKIKYGKKETLGEQREKNISVTSLIGYETAVFIANPKRRTGRVNKVYINLKKRKDAEYLATFNVKFYQFDSINKMPGKKLYSKNFYVQPKNKKYRLWIDVKDLKIRLPKNGICVSVEMVNTVGKVKKYSYFGPMYRYTFIEDKVLQTWSNYHNTGWRDGSLKYRNLKRTKIGVLKPMIGVEVEYILD